MSTLKLRKLVSNKPKYHDGKLLFDANNIDAAAMAGGAISFTGDMMNAFGPVLSGDELVGNAARSQSNVGGSSYTEISPIDLKAELDSLNTTGNTLKAAGSGAALGGSIGSMFGPIGGAIGAGAGALIGGITGFFGGKSRERKLKQRIAVQNLRIENMNTQAFSSAQSDAMTQNYYNKNGNYNGLLFG